MPLCDLRSDVPPEHTLDCIDSIIPTVCDGCCELRLDAPLSVVHSTRTLTSVSLSLCLCVCACVSVSLCVCV